MKLAINLFQCKNMECTLRESCKRSCKPGRKDVIYWDFHYDVKDGDITCLNKVDK